MLKVGLKRKFKCGNYATIIKYIDDSDLDIEFDTGEIVKHLNKQDFTNRSITPSSLKKEPKVNYQKVKEAFDEKGYTLISTEYKGARETLYYLCPFHPEEGIQETKWVTMQKGRGCKKCGYERVSEILKEKKKIYTFKDVEKFFSQKMKDFTLVSEEKDYINSDTKIKYICPKHKEVVQEKMFSVLKLKPWCSMCAIEEGKAKLKTPFSKVVEDFAVEGYKVITKEEDYINAATKIMVSCEKHGEFSIRYGHLKEGKGCPSCGEITKRNKIRKDFNIVKKDIEKEGFILLSPEKDYKTITSKLKLECPKHKGKVFYNSYSHIVHSHIGCPRCNESKGERRIRLLLDLHNVKYTPQKRFKDLYRHYGKYLSYDFYIPDKQLLIEYQGEFHTMITNRSNEKRLEDQKERDKLKSTYAQDNGFNLLEIWHWDYENIEEILMKEGVI